MPRRSYYPSSPVLTLDISLGIPLVTNKFFFPAGPLWRVVGVVDCISIHFIAF
jgi:hypothetical protein